MRAIRISQTGGPDVLALASVPEPTPGLGEVLVRHHAIGLNFIDTYQRSGLYPIKLPATLGLEAAGTVEAVGDGVTRCAVGDRVGYNGTLGAYADANLVKADRVVRLPDDVSFETAAAVLLKGMTAEFLARRILSLHPGDIALVYAAAGGVGTILTQWLKSLGVEVIGTVGSPEKAEAARRRGVDHVLSSRSDDIAAKVKDITGGRGVRIAYDSVGRATFDSTLVSLGRRGMFVSFGNASGPAPAVEPLQLSRGGSLFLTRPTLFDYILTTEELDDSAAALFGLIERGAIGVEIGRTFPLEQARQAHQALEGRETSGATLLLP